MSHIESRLSTHHPQVLLLSPHSHSFPFPDAAPPTESESRDLHHCLFQDQHSPLFNLLHKWYIDAQEELASKEQTLGEIKAKHQMELNDKNIEISSLTAQVTKLNSALEDATRKLEEATQTIEKMKGVAVNDESSHVSFTTGNIADVALTVHENEPHLNSESTVKVSAGETKWDRHYTDLIAYKQQHGNCNVPTRCKENISLGNWVHNVRQRFKRGELSDERVAMLDEIGFAWKPKKQKADSDWTTRYNDLVAYKQQHGHCNVPTRCKEYRNLGTWVNNLRQHFKRGELSDERVAMLDKIGFIWKLKKQKADSDWTTRCNELVAYKKRHGHCNVPSRCNSAY